MQITSALLGGLAMVVTTIASPALPLEDRSIGSSCSTPDGAGTCQQTTNCVSQGFNLAGYCPHDASNVQCCVKRSCSTSAGSGLCLNTADGCSAGSFHSGACPGTSAIQCCVKGSTPPPPPPPPTGASGAGIVAAAQREEGLPYVWGGGGCAGPSGGGFDCSGLTQYAICQAEHKTIPRTAQTQYHSPLGHHLPRADARPGDLLFWATGGDCAGSVVHVGIFERAGYMVNAAHSGTPVREQAVWLSSGGEEICPDAVRFW